MSNQEALRELIQRFAISALSVERKHEAVNEEIMLNKYTGDFHIKTKDGIVLSVDNINREKATIDEAVRIAELMGMTGKCYKIDFENKQLPTHIDYSTNIMQNDTIELPANTKDVLLYLDVDEFSIIDNEYELLHGETSVTISFEIYDGKNLIPVIFNKKIKDVNFSVFSFKEYNNIQRIKLNSVKISKLKNEQRAMILHNMFISINE